MKISEKNAGNLPLEGGNLCLDFVNSVDWRISDKKRKEWLKSFSDLILWGRHANILNEKTAQTLSTTTEKYPNKAEQAYKKAIELREILFRIFSSFAVDRKPKDCLVLLFNRYLAEAMSKSCLSVSQDSFVWSFCDDSGSLESLFYPIIKSAADLMVSSELSRVKICADDCCGWLFIDMSRNKSRRWCNMKDCGNRAKAKRHYYRKSKKKINQIKGTKSKT